MYEFHAALVDQLSIQIEFQIFVVGYLDDCLLGSILGWVFGHHLQRQDHQIPREL